MSPQGVVSSKKASYSPGLSPIKGQNFSPGTQTRSWDLFWSLSWVSPRPRHLAQCWLINQRLNLFFYMSSRDSQGRLRSKKPQNRTAPCELIGSLITSYSSMSRGYQYSPTACQVEMSFNAFWHWWIKGDILTAWSAFKAAWLSEQILTYFTSLFWNCIL